MKLSIEQTDNGFIVKIIKTGLGALKDPYVKPVMVFTSFESLIDYLQCLNPKVKEGKIRS